MLHASANYVTYKAGRNQRNHAQDKECNAHNSLRYRKRHAQEFWTKIMTVVLLLQQMNETDKSDDVVSHFAANAKKIHKRRAALKSLIQYRTFSSRYAIF